MVFDRPSDAKGKEFRVPSSVQKFNIVVGKDRLHPQQKPIELMEYLVKTYSNEGDIILDITMGVGTTYRAAKNLNRNYIGIEKEKKFYDIAVERLNT